jgi:parvulin-like peptidyl-prolyl isomerase
MAHLSIGNHTITSAEIPHLLAGFQMLPQLCRLLVIETAISLTELTQSEKLGVIEQFYQNNQLTTPEAIAKALKHYSMSLEQLEAVAMRELKIEKFKQATWGTKLESYFLQCKPQLDKVIYSLIRTKDAEVAQELYFRIKAGEQTFAECASVYSQGAEAQTQGMLGPVTISQPHPAIAQKLTISQPGQLWPPMKLDEWFVIVRLEKLIPAQLDDAMRSTLLNHLFETWLAEEMNKAQLTLHQEEESEMGRWGDGEVGTHPSITSSPYPPITPLDTALVTR